MVVIVYRARTPATIRALSLVTTIFLSLDLKDLDVVVQQITRHATRQSVLCIADPSATGDLELEAITRAFRGHTQRADHPLGELVDN